MFHDRLIKVDASKSIDEVFRTILTELAKAADESGWDEKDQKAVSEGAPVTSIEELLKTSKLTAYSGHLEKAGISIQDVLKAGIY